MAKFINKKTGNILNIKDEITIALMNNSERYEPVKEKKKKLASDNQTQSE